MSNMLELYVQAKARSLLEGCGVLLIWLRTPVTSHQKMRAMNTTQEELRGRWCIPSLQAILKVT